MHMDCPYNQTLDQRLDYSKNRIDDETFLHFHGYLMGSFAILAFAFTLIFIATTFRAMRLHRGSRKYRALLLNRAIGDLIGAASVTTSAILTIISPSANRDAVALIGCFFYSTFWSAFISYTSLSLLKLYAVLRPFSYRKVFTFRKCIYIIAAYWIIFIACISMCAGVVTVHLQIHWFTDHMHGFRYFFSTFTCFDYTFTIVIFIVTVIVLKKVEMNEKNAMNNTRGESCRSDRGTRFGKTGWNGSQCVSSGLLNLNCGNAGWTCNDAYACPGTPPAYNENFARNQLWRLHAAQAQNLPTDIGFIGCMQAADEEAVFLGRVQVTCGFPLPTDPCTTDVFALPGSNAIVASTLGTAANTTQLINALLALTIPLTTNGVIVYWDNANSLLWPGVETILSSAFASTSPYSGYNLVLTGHSIGAAVAVLMAGEAAQASWLPSTAQVSSITFGEPRIGNYAFLDSNFAAAPNHLRIINQNDVITTLPVELGVFHTKYPVQYKNGMNSTFLGTQTICNTYEASNCAANALGGIPILAPDYHNTYFGIPDSYPTWRVTNCSYAGI